MISEVSLDTEDCDDAQLCHHRNK